MKISKIIKKLIIIVLLIIIFAFLYLILLFGETNREDKNMFFTRNEAHDITEKHLNLNNDSYDNMLLQFKNPTIVSKSQPVKMQFDSSYINKNFVSKLVAEYNIEDKTYKITSEYPISLLQNKNYTNLKLDRNNIISFSGLTGIMYEKDEKIYILSNTDSTFFTIEFPKIDKNKIEEELHKLKLNK